jgi:hypothetical protein
LANINTTKRLKHLRFMEDDFAFLSSCFVEGKATPATLNTLYATMLEFFERSEDISDDEFDEKNALEDQTFVFFNVFIHRLFPNGICERNNAVEAEMEEVEAFFKGRLSGGNTVPSCSHNLASHTIAVRKERRAKEKQIMAAAEQRRAPSNATATATATATARHSFEASRCGTLEELYMDPLSMMYGHSQEGFMEKLAEVGKTNQELAALLQQKVTPSCNTTDLLTLFLIAEEVAPVSFFSDFPKPISTSSFLPEQAQPFDDGFPVQAYTNATFTTDCGADDDFPQEQL